MIYLLTPNCHPEHREGSRVHPLLAAQRYRDPSSPKLLWMTNANYQLSIINYQLKNYQFKKWKTKKNQCGVKFSK